MKEMKFAFTEWHTFDVVACFYEPDPIDFPQKTGIYTVPPQPQPAYFGLKQYEGQSVIPWLQERGIKYEPHRFNVFSHEIIGTPDQMFEVRMRWC